jgi:hypothetical protein
VTQEELNIWRQRAQNGPYKTAGDVSTNSPGDWTTIVANARSFANNPLVDNWDGNTTSSTWNQNTVCTGQNQWGGGCYPWHTVGVKILHGAFASLVDPANHPYAAQVRTALLNQIARPGVDFTNTAKWCNCQIGDGNSFAITNWLTRLVFAYSYVRNDSIFSASERLAIDTWFSNAAYYWAKNVNYLVAGSAFPQRNVEFDTSVNVGGTYPTDILGPSPGSGSITHYDCANTQRGHLAGSNHEIWNNRSASQIRFAAAGSLIHGTLSHDAQSQRWAKMWFKEWLTYATFADNMPNDYKRWTTSAPTQGWVYASLAIGEMAVVADLFARAGDTSLYDFSTSAGSVYSNNPPGYNGNTNGGPKSLLKVIQRHASFVPQFSTHSPNWHGHDNAANCGNFNYLISPIDNILYPPPTGSGKVNDTYYIFANLYYKDPTVKSMYTRTAAGAPPYPAYPDALSYSWGGENGVYPGVLFMFGQMEGVVWPYPGGPSGSLLTAPSNLRILSAQ